MPVLYSKLTCTGRFRSINLLGPNLSLRYRVMVIASMTEGGPEALVALESEKQLGCWMCGDTHLKV